MNGDPWLIKHPAAVKWLGVYGWTPAKVGALQFPTLGDAQAWADKTVPNVEYEIEQVTVQVADPGTSGFSNPFGYDTHV